MSDTSSENDEELDERLIRAVRNADVPGVQELLYQGVNLNAKHNHNNNNTEINPDDDDEPDSSGGETALHFACRDGIVEIAELLIDHGAEVHARQNDGQTPLHAVCSVRGGLEVPRLPQLLVENGADIHSRDNDGFTPLHRACLEGHLKPLVSWLIRNGADVRAKSKHGLSPLDLACQCGHLGVTRLLIGYGVNVRNRDDLIGWTPLHWACRKVGLEKHIRPVYKRDYMQIPNLLIDCGANMYVKDKEGETVLHLACRYGHLQLAQLLMSRWSTVAVNVVDIAGWTPLHYASHCGYLEITKLLTANGADIHAKNSRGETPLYLACTILHSETYCQEIADFLIESGAEINAADNDGQTALHRVCQFAFLERAQFMMSRGANVNAETTAGITPLNIACENDYLLDILWVLVRNQYQEVVPL